VSASPIEPNIRAVSKLAQLAGEAMGSVGTSGKKVALVLPDMAIRAFVLAGDVKPTLTELSARIAPRLSYPQGEARLSTWQGPSSWTVVAAVRQVVLRQYEQALEALGYHVAWVDGASLAVLPDWVREDQRSDPNNNASGLRILVQLYPRHYTLSVLCGSELLDIRTKLRSFGDESRIVEQIARLPSLFNGAELQEVTVRGEGAAALAAELEIPGIGPRRVHMGDDGEEAHLAYALELLLRRF
jgi:hypothetical protein